MTLEPGHMLSHYRVIEKLGEGGMGEVYLAEDTRLDRKVAIKVLPMEFARDPEQVSRLKLEARFLAALNHPNIASIHGLEHSQGIHFLALEHVPGETLADRLACEAVPVNDALILGMQIARSLEAAHKTGIIHRDLKPANIMVTPNGQAKILDFGLAKAFVPSPSVSQIAEAPTRTLGQTKPHTVLGTTHYMSPEQASGKPVDKLTDIWAFGCVLYEILAGQKAFPGKTVSLALAAIHGAVPDWERLPPETPESIKRSLRHCLEKNRDFRLRDIGDARIELEEALDEDSSHRAQSNIGARSRRTGHHQRGSSSHRKLRHASLLASPRFVLVLGALLAVSALGVAALVIWLGNATGQTSVEAENAPPGADHSSLTANSGFPQLQRLRPLTTAPGLEYTPSFSPDGTRIAYSSDGNGNMDVWVRTITGGKGINLTEDHKGYDGNPSWSPSGEWIAFLSSRDEGGIFILPAMGGHARHLTSLSFTPNMPGFGAPRVCWSPDGTELAFATVDSLASSDGLYTVSADGGVPSILNLQRSKTGWDAIAEPAWSPDNSRIAYTNISGSGVTTSQIISVQANGAAPIMITDANHLNHHPVWSADGKRIFFISDRGGTRDLWLVDINHQGEPIGEAHALTTGIGIGGFALSRDETTLVYSRAIERSNIWSIPLASGRKPSLKAVVPITSENHFIEHLDVSPDGKWIAFDSNRSGNMDIWVMDNNGKNLRQITVAGAHDWAPRWSNDGTQIAFYSLRTGNRDVFVKPVTGGASRRLTSHPADDRYPNWSPSGESVVFESSRGGSFDLWMVPSDGGSPRQITFRKNRDAFSALWSSDESRLAFQSTDDEGFRQIFLLNVVNGESQQLTHTKWNFVAPLFWSADASTLHVMTRESGGNSKYQVVSTADGSVNEQVDFKGSPWEPLQQAAKHENRLFVGLWERAGDLWSADLTVAHREDKP